MNTALGRPEEPTAPRYFFRDEIKYLIRLRITLVPTNARIIMTTGSANHFSTAGYIDSMPPFIPYRGAVFHILKTDAGRGYA